MSQGKTYEKDPYMVKVLDIPLYNKNISEASAHFVAVCTTSRLKENRLVSATGAHGLVFAQKNPAFKQLLLSFYMNLPDGMPGVWVGRIKGEKFMERCYGPDFFRSVMINSGKENIKHFFCGGNPGIADELNETVKKKFNNDNVVGTYCPPFLPVDKYDYATIARLITTSKADIVWIGLSTPKQETFAKMLSEFTKVHFIVTVGAAFDFHTGKVAQAPSVLQRAGLEWLFRLTMEPKRLYKRYFEIVPMFIFYNLRELFTFATRKIT